MKRSHLFPKIVGGFQLYKLFLPHTSFFTLEGFFTSAKNFTASCNQNRSLTSRKYVAVQGMDNKILSETSLFVWSHSFLEK